jgi:ribonuclease P protein component
MKEPAVHGTGDKPNGVRGSFRFPAASRLLKHAAFDRVYKEGSRIFSGNMTVFFRRRDLGENLTGPRVGFTVSRAMGGAVVRNRIKRRLRAAVRLHLAGLDVPVDVVINPKRTTAAAGFAQLTVEMQRAFRQIQCGKPALNPRGARQRSADTRKGSPA